MYRCYPWLKISPPVGFQSLNPSAHWYNPNLLGTNQDNLLN